MGGVNGSMDISMDEFNLPGNKTENCEKYRTRKLALFTWKKVCFMKMTYLTPISFDADNL